MSKRWRYFSVNLFGNAHDAVRQINVHPEWDVISMSFTGENGTPGSVTLVVYRIEIPEITDGEIAAVTDAQIHELMRTRQVGDHNLDVLYRRALGGVADARKYCAEIIRDRKRTVEEP